MDQVIGVCHQRTMFDDLSRLVAEIENRDSNDRDAMIFLMDALEFAINGLISHDDAHLLNELLVNLSAIYQILCQEIRELTFTKIKLMGRPKIKIEKELLVELRNFGFTWAEVSSMLLVSRWTVRRRVKELGIEDRFSYSDITDDELDEYVRHAKVQFGSLAGRSIVMGYLKSLGIRIQRRRVINSLLRVDPESSHLRWACLIKRRKYSVPGVNSLWHADGHHSLIRWGFVIHGAIDGYSRLVVYLKCSTNNRAETVLRNFDLAIKRYGTPSRLRTDKGGENVLLWNEMERLRGRDRGSYIAGSSVHNQRIERLWRDVWTFVAHQFYYTFQALEAEGKLDVEKVEHMYILHHVFLPRINRTLEIFIDGWNKHPLRTEKNWSPEKIWTNGMMKSGLQSELMSNSDLSWFGYDPDAPHPSEIDTSDVLVNDCVNPYSDIQLQILRTVDVLRHSTSYGIDIFIEVLNAINAV